MSDRGRAPPPGRPPHPTEPGAGASAPGADDVGGADARADEAGHGPAPRRSTWVTTVDAVFPHHANPLGTIFGGRVLELLDVNAAIACQRFARSRAVTASTEAIDFRSPVHVGEILELKSRVAWTGRTSMIVRCEVFVENPITGERRLCTMGHMNFVAVGDDGRPRHVPAVLVETDEERAHHAEAEAVREGILQRRGRV